MGSSETLKDQQGDGDASPEIGGTLEQWEHLCSELGKLSVVTGKLREALRQSDHRRVESLQGPVNETIQGTEEALKELQEAYYPYWYTYPSGDR